MSKELLIIFTRNPVLGKVKTRLSSRVGDAAALRVYKYLLEHTRSITQDLEIEKRVYYSNHIDRLDLWKEPNYSKRQQIGVDLGERMQMAFQEGIDDGFSNIILIGSDLYDLNQAELDHAFELLDSSEFVIGPAKDGGYYLIGMKQPIDDIFKNKKWGSSSVLRDTLNDLHGKSVSLLEKKNDIDQYEDLAPYETLKKLL